MCINLSVKKKTLTYIPILVFSFFPYVSLYHIDTDLQPWGILITSLFALLLFFKNEKFSFEIALLWLPFLYSLGLIPFSLDIFYGIRSLTGYLAIAVYPFVFYYLLKYQYDLFEKFLKITTFIYLFVGLVQMYFYKNFMSFLLSRMTTTEDRGVTSLTPEPTFYGIVCLFLILIFSTLDIKGKYKYILLLLFQIIFIAQSSMTILFLVLFGIYHTIFKFDLKVTLLNVIFIAISVMVVLHLDYEIIRNVRILNLMNILIEQPMLIYFVDASINDRLSAIFFSVKGFFDNNLLPNGFGTYSTYIHNELPNSNIFVWVSDNRIMSFYGSILFELGFIGLIIPIVYSYIILKAYNKVRDSLVYLFFINTILWSAIPLSFPFVGIYIAALLYRAKYQVKSKGK